MSITHILLLTFFLLVIDIVLFFISKRCWNSKCLDLFFVVFCILLLVFLFELIYYAFFSQFGYPAGPGLKNSDWLAFLSGYLSFAGALIMALLVYRQSKTINEITSQEYRVSFKSVANSFVFSSYSDNERKQVFSGLIGKPEQYINHDIVFDPQRCCEPKPPSSSEIPFIYISLINMGKLRVDNLFFDCLEINPPSNQRKKTLRRNKQSPSYYYSFSKERGGNFLNGKHSVLPNACLHICLIPNCFPSQLSLSIIRISFRYYIGKHEEKQTIQFFVEKKVNPTKLLFSDWENSVTWEQER